jgi:hypothetical protein
MRVPIRSPWTARFTSVTVAQISEFSFIFAAVGMNAGLIDQSILSLIAIVGLITIVGSVYMILYNEPLYNLMRKWGMLRMFGASASHDPDSNGSIAHSAMADHVIIVGMNALGRLLAQSLHERGEKVLAIDTDIRKLAGLPCETMTGNVDYLSVLKEASLHKAKLAITALMIEDVNRLFAYRCQIVGVPVAVHVFDRSVLRSAQELSPRFIIDSKHAADSRVEHSLAELGVLIP